MYENVGRSRRGPVLSMLAGILVTGLLFLNIGSATALTTSVDATSVIAAQAQVGQLVSANVGAATAAAVDAVLTPRLIAASVQALLTGRATATATVDGVRIDCVITYPPLRIRCTISFG